MIACRGIYVVVLFVIHISSIFEFKFIYTHIFRFLSLRLTFFVRKPPAEKLPEEIYGEDAGTVGFWYFASAFSTPKVLFKNGLTSSSGCSLRKKLSKMFKAVSPALPYHDKIGIPFRGWHKKLIGLLSTRTVLAMSGASTFPRSFTKVFPLICVQSVRK